MEPRSDAKSRDRSEHNSDAAKPAVAAAYARLEAELRETRRGWIVTGVSALVITIAVTAFLISDLIHVGEVRLLKGTAIATRQVSDDEGHDVRLVIELDGGESVFVRAVPTVLIGSRVVVSERTTLLGRRKYNFVKLVPDS
jgi:hypothetical protein